MPRIQGCWTCRLRRKKCTGELSTCSNCGRLDVRCYGYGTKPVWMDGGSREKEVLNKIKESVKVSTDGKRRGRALRGLKSFEKRKGEKEHGEPIPQVQADLLHTSPVSGKSLCQDGAGFLSRSVKVDQPLTPLWKHDPELESFLLMHYLDFVIPIQYPFYDPVMEGGRGWLLGLLMRARPLYSAALSLAAYHRKVSSTKLSSRDRKEVGERPGELYSLALHGLREHVGDLSKKGLREGLKDSIEILACVIQLIMFEVARGGFENWQLHLLAAPDIHPFLQTYCTHPSQPTIPMPPTIDTRNLSFVDHAAMEFFSGVIIYIDILACASTGLRPQYADICSAALGAEGSKVQLQNIMGCENWAMVLIREIAVLWDWKRRTVERGVLRVRKLERETIDIERRLYDGLERLSEGHSSSPNTRNDRGTVVRRITHAYAHAAKVYLKVLVSGPNPDLPEIIESVSSTLTALETLPERQLLRNVVWPFCIASCMARDGQRQGIRDLASASGVHREVFGSSWRAVEVMEMCWKMRDGGESCDWFNAMEALGYHVLLV